MAQDLCKYYKKQRFVSYNDGLTWQPLEEYEKGELYETHSASCGAGVFQYRWVLVNNAYICDGKDRYTREIYQYSEDGVVWYNVFPTVYRKGYLVESNSPFCDNAGGGQYIDDGTNPSGETPCPPDYHWDGSECVCDGVMVGGKCIVCKGGQVWTGTECACTGDTYWNGSQCVRRQSGGATGHSCFDCNRDPYKAVKCSNSNGILTSADTQYYSSGWAILSYEVGDCIYRLDDNVFNGQTYMSAVTIPSTVVEVGDWAFSSCQSLPTVSFPTTALTELGEGAFSNCSELTSASFGGTIPTALSDSLFSNCISLESATWLQYNNITSIGNKTFHNCYSLNNVTLPNSLTSIGNQAFYSNYAMENITIPSGVTSIGTSAFENCTAMTFANVDAVGGTKNTIRTPEYIIKNGKTTYLDIDEVFTEDTIIEIEFEKSDSYYNSLIGDTSGKLDLHWNNGKYTAGNTLFFTYGSGEISGTVPFRNKKMHIQIGNKYVKDLNTNTYLLSGNSVSFTNTSGNIRLFNLSSGKNLTTANIYSIKIIKGNKIVRDIIPYTNNDNSKYYFFDKITNTIITSYAYYSSDIDGFSGSSIVNEYVYDDPFIVGDGAFQGCTNLTAATFESSAVTMGNNAFNGCDRLLKLTFTSPTPFEIKDGYFDNTNGCAIFVPCGSVDAYKYAWYQYADRISCNDTGIYYRWIDDPSGIYCDGTNQYTRQKQQSTTNGITWTDTGVYRPITFITHYSEECGYQGEVALTVTNSDGFIRYYESCDGPELQYRTVSGTPFCSGETRHDKYVEVYSQESADGGETWVTTATTTVLVETESQDCVLYRWVNSGTTCITGNLWQQQIKQVSLNGGQTWDNVIPETYSATTLIENKSLECMISKKFVAYYSNSSFYEVECSSSDNVITSAITRGYSTSYSSMTDAFITDCATGIYNYAFSGGSAVNNSFSSLSSVTIGNNVTWIGNGAFYRCMGLRSIDIPDSVTSIGGSAFAGCTSLTSVTIPDSVTNIGDAAFSGCTSLPIENNIRYADTYAVEASNKTLSSYTIKNGTKYIGSQAFYNCSNLSSVTIPNTVTHIYYGAFNWCQNLATINIPNSVKYIGYYSFCYCTSLSTLTIPDSVTNVDYDAFESCSGLTSVTIGTGITSISDSTFSRCYSLESINIPDNVTSIGQYAFQYCSGLTNVTIGSGVTSIGEYAFENCRGLNSVTVNIATPPALGSSVFRNTNDCIIYVPAESVEVYKAASGWSTYASRIQAIP